MCFKPRTFKTLFKFPLYFFCALSLMLGACSVNTGEQPPQPVTQTFGGAQCLSDALPVITDFIQGQATDAQVSIAWDCFSSAIEQFKKRIIGSSGDSYTSAELATFLEDNFLKFKDGKKISPELQAQVMKFKQILIGGSKESLSRKELDDTIVLFQKLKALALKLNPYMKVYSLSWSLSKANNIQADTAFFEKANSVLQDGAKDLAALVQKNNQGYELSDFSSFVSELNGLYDHPWDFTEKIPKYMPIVKKVKKAVSGGDEDSVVPEEWRSFLLLGSRGYVQYLRYYYFIRTAADTGTGIRLGYISRVIEDSLSIFQDLVIEKPGGLVTRDEVAEILKTFSKAWPDFKISDNLIYEAMKIKQLILGGTTDSFTSADFGLARLKVAKVKTIVERIMPYCGVYGLDWDRTGMKAADIQSFFSEAKANLEKTSQDFATLFEIPFDMNNFYSLVHEVIVLYSADPKNNATDQAIKKYLPLAIDIKNVTFAENDSLIKKSQWPQVLSASSRAYSLFMYEQYFYKGNTFRSTSGLAAIEVLVDRGLDILKDLVAINPLQKFRQAEVNEIIQRLVNLEILPNSLSSDSMKILVDVVLNRVLVAPQDRINGNAPAALTKSSIEILRFETLGWLDQEKFSVDLFPHGDESYSGSQLRKIISSIRSGRGPNTPLKSAVTELSMMLNSPVPLTIDLKAQMIISNQTTQNYKLRSLSQLNLNRLIARLLVRSYARDVDRINNFEGLRLEEIQKAYADLKPIGVELGLLDPTNDNFPVSRFREANIFTPRANGDGLASFLEVSDLIGMVWSGLNINSLLKKDLVSSCLNSRRNVRFDTTVDIPCMMKVYTQRMPSYMTSMPGFESFMQVVAPDQWESYLNNVLKAAGHIPNDLNRARMADVSLIPHVIQYIEMIFAKYDGDGNSVIDTKEALQAFPLFQGIMKDLAKGQVPDDELGDVFAFILKFGKPPETVSEKLKYTFSWKNKPEKWDIQADRTQLAKILGYIADQVAKQAADKANGN